MYVSTYLFTLLLSISHTYTQTKRTHARAHTLTSRCTSYQPLSTSINLISTSINLYQPHINLISTSFDVQSTYINLYQPHITHPHPHTFSFYRAQGGQRRSWRKPLGTAETEEMSGRGCWSRHHMALLFGAHCLHFLGVMRDERETEREGGREVDRQAGR